jgi:hypothetical protein
MGKLSERRNHRFAQANLSAYLDGELDEGDAARVRAHLGRCQECCREVAALQTAIRVLSGLPRAPLPCSFALGAEAVRGQQRIRRLDAGFAALRAAGAALTLALVLLLSGEQLLARGVIGLPAGSAAPQQMRMDAVEPELVLVAPEADLRKVIVETESAESMVAMAAPEVARAPESQADMEDALPAEMATSPVGEESAPPAEPPAAPSEDAPLPAESPTAALREERPTPGATPTAPQPESTKAPPATLPPAEETRPALGVAAATPAAGLEGAPTPEANTDAMTPGAVSPEAAPERVSPPAPGAAAATQTPTATLAPTPTETPSFEATPTHQEPAPKPTHTPTPEAVAAEEPVVMVEAEAAVVAETEPLAEAPEEPAAEAALAPEPAPEREPYPEELALALELGLSRAAEDVPSEEPDQVRMAAAQVGTEDSVSTVRTVLRQSLAILGGITLMVFGGLLWVGYKRRL